MQILPVQVAHRGFEHELTVSWIYGRIEQAIKKGVLSKPVHILPPGGLVIQVHFAIGLIEYWKQQFQRGIRAEASREFWDEIDRILGVSTSEPSGE